MNHWKRFSKAVNFEEVDHIPVALWITARCFASLSGLSVFDFIHDYHKMVEAETYAFKRFSDVTFIPGVIPDYGDGILIPSALGCKIFWSENTLPVVAEPRLIHEDSDVDMIKIPHPKHDGFLPWYLKTLEIFLKRKQDFGDNLHFIKSLGPGEETQSLWGMDNLLLNISLKPELTKRLLARVTDIILMWLDAQAQVIGQVDGIVLSDDIAGLMSKQHYLEFLYPFHCKIRKKYPDQIMIFHCDTKADHLLESFADVGINVFNFGPATDIRMVKEKIGNRVTLMGNLDPVHILQQGDVSTVKKTSQACIDAGKKGGGYILSAGGGVNYGTPPENIEAMIEAARANSYAF